MRNVYIERTNAHQKRLLILTHYFIIGLKKLKFEKFSKTAKGGCIMHSRNSMVYVWFCNTNPHDFRSIICIICGHRNVAVDRHSDDLYYSLKHFENYTEPLSMCIYSYLVYDIKNHSEIFQQCFTQKYVNNNFQMKYHLSCRSKTVSRDN